MASSNNSLLLPKMRGQIGKQIVVKQYGNKTVITKYPDMGGIKPSKPQKKLRSRFADAVTYARAIINDPAKKAAYAMKIKKGQTVYHYAIKEYYRKKAVV